MSSDALQCVNQFLDEFIVLILLQLNNTMETTRIKQACFQLLPNILGKNALVEADLQIKGQFSEYAFDHVDTILPILRSRCIQQCTLSSVTMATEKGGTIPDWVITYITAMMEHIGEHVLTSVANHTDKVGHISVKDVYFALKEDAQLALLFSRMDLHDKIQKRVGISFINNRPRSCYLPQSRERYTTIATKKRNSVVEISFDDLDDEEQEDHLNSQATSVPEPIKYSTRKFKPPPRVQSVYAPDFPKTNFEDLIKSNSTVKVSLTPNRLKSIEDNTFEEKAESFIARSRRSTLASLRRIASTVKRPTSAPVTKKKNKDVQDDDAVKRPISTPPIRQHKHTPSSSQLSTCSSSPRTSHMSIPSLSEASNSHYSTSSLASTLSNTSLGKELSTIGEEDHHYRKREHEIIPIQQQQQSITQILIDDDNHKHREKRLSSPPPPPIQQQQPERPSSIVARRANRLGNTRPQSYHESLATSKYAEMTDVRHSLRHGVLDKVLHFERATLKKKRGVDQAVQTEPLVESDDEEEWFIQDDELDEQDEADIVNWLLG
ncbi:hypothetical protein K501DRAFT_232140, partial [Backusella circina FSU 941]